MKFTISCLVVWFSLLFSSSSHALSPGMDRIKIFYEDTLRDYPLKLFQRFVGQLHSEIEQSVQKLHQISTADFELASPEQTLKAYQDFQAESDHVRRLRTMQYCVESLQNGFSDFSVPLSSQFDEMDFSHLKPPEKYCPKPPADCSFYWPAISEAYQQACENEGKKQLEEIAEVQSWIEQHPLTVEMIREKATSLCQNK